MQAVRPERPKERGQVQTERLRTLPCPPPPSDVSSEGFERQRRVQDAEPPVHASGWQVQA